MKKRVITYIDGFNLYFGIRSKYGRKYYWLDLEKLSNNILINNQILIGVKYFTSRIESPEDKRKRQLLYLEALESLDKIQLFFGKYLINPSVCKNCGFKSHKPSEKETDVNIALEILTDAIKDSYDIALIISGDSDLSPAIKKTKELFPEKKLISVFPPHRVSSELKNISDAYFNLSEVKIRKSLFPDKIIKSDGYIINQPEHWK